MTLGKPIGNGYPLAAVVTTPEIAASFDNGMEYFNTFGGNPVACAVGLAVLEVIETEQLQANALRIGDMLLQGMRQLMRRHPIVGDVRGAGLFLGIELVRDRESLEPADSEAQYVVNRLRNRGILISTDDTNANGHGVSLLHDTALWLLYASRPPGRDRGRPGRGDHRPRGDPAGTAPQSRAIPSGLHRYAEQQEALSGGEAQRVKIAAELTKLQRRGHVVYILDELRRTAHSSVCPHGRPVIVRLSRREIEKRFERI